MPFHLYFQTRFGDPPLLQTSHELAFTFLFLALLFSHIVELTEYGKEIQNSTHLITYIATDSLHYVRLADLSEFPTVLEHGYTIGKKTWPSCNRLRLSAL